MNSSESSKIVVRMAVKAYLEVQCEKSPHGCCLFAVSREPAHVNDGGVHIWQWDGNINQPTLTPSIDCKGCGRHFIVTKGNAA